MHALLLTLALAAPATAEEPAPTEPAVAEVPAKDEPAVAETSEEGLLVDRDGPTLLLVVGASGAPEYATQFTTWAARWETAAAQGGVRVRRIDAQTEAPRQQFESILADETKSSPHELWIVLIGHGTFDGRVARFNLPGPDVSADDLAGWLDDFDRPVAVINCASASGPFLTALSRPGRVVITATKSGQEQNFARFGDLLSQHIANPEADLDHDGQTSLLEAWLMAARRTDEFYFSEGRLPTEHAILDDTGDGEGVRPDAFQGVRPAQSFNRGAASEGTRAGQFCLVRSAEEQQIPAAVRQQRDALEREIHTLHARKSELASYEYYEQLETLLVRLAEMSIEGPAQSADQGKASPR
ncbi:MAG: hypothetical protein IT428_24235 [Planctomycetaceae bacterium]|nr:hypothetical protein [Planctomycetaceae bacterium]